MKSQIPKSKFQIELTSQAPMTNNLEFCSLAFICYLALGIWSLSYIGVFVPAGNPVVSATNDPATLITKVKKAPKGGFLAGKRPPSPCTLHLIARFCQAEI
jgi:hypothetical protein